MESGKFWCLEGVSDRELQCALAALLGSSSRTEARIVAHIAEVEERRLHLEAGCSSMFEYCTKRLQLSESEAFHRIAAARVARQFPIVFALLERRNLHLTAICLLREYLTPENHAELLAEASHKTKWQVQELIARRFPSPDVASRIRKLPELRRRAASAEAPAGALAPPPVAPTPPSAAQPPTLPIRGTIEPTSSSQYRIQLNASAALKEKLELLRSLTSHSNPQGDLAAVIERAVDVALEQVQRKRFAQTTKPREASTRGVLRRKGKVAARAPIPNATLRDIATRDGLRCTFVGNEGARCEARAFLQVHHEHAWARGGSDRPDNLRLLCASHNRLLAERDFGAAHVAQRVAAQRAHCLDKARPGMSALLTGD